MLLVNAADDPIVPPPLLESAKQYAGKIVITLIDTQKQNKKWWFALVKQAERSSIPLCFVPRTTCGRNLSGGKHQAANSASSNFLEEWHNFSSCNLSYCIDCESSSKVERFSYVAATIPVLSWLKDFVSLARRDGVPYTYGCATHLHYILILMTSLDRRNYYQNIGWAYFGSRVRVAVLLLVDCSVMHIFIPVFCVEQQVGAQQIFSWCAVTSRCTRTLKGVRPMLWSWGARGTSSLSPLAYGGAASVHLMIEFFTPCEIKGRPLCISVPYPMEHGVNIELSFIYVRGCFVVKFEFKEVTTEGRSSFLLR